MSVPSSPVILGLQNSSLGWEELGAAGSTLVPELCVPTELLPFPTTELLLIVL